jgi:hypothetical protein
MACWTAKEGVAIAVVEAADEIAARAGASRWYAHG